MSEGIVRFSRRQRVEHLVAMTLFLVLVVTGLPQKYFEAGWAQTIIGGIGGIDRARWIHRWAGILLAVFTGVHLATALSGVLSGRTPLSLVPSRKDFHDAIIMLRYYLGMSDQQARFDRFDYRQKFEYWGLVFGSLVMIVTGFALYFPVTVARYVPGEAIPAAKLAHGSEGLLAFLVVVIWHIYNAHLSPDVFPFDASIFTGEVSRERMEKEHPLEYARLQAAGEPEERSGA